jgi:hypothetical protein
MKAKKKRVNFWGKPVLGEAPVYKNSKWGCYCLDGNTVWAEPYFEKFRQPNTDEFGFDKSKDLDGNGNYKVEHWLKPGDLICRFGGPRGSYTTAIGATYEMVGLPYYGATCEFHVYRVKKEIRVMKGYVAPIFDSPGGAVQYHHIDEKINAEIAAGNLEEIDDFLDLVKNNK